MNEVKGETPSITNLATKTTLNAVENKISSVSNLVRKTNYDKKINEFERKTTDHNHDKYITTTESNKLTSETSAASKIKTSKFSKQNWYC